MSSKLEPVIWLRVLVTLAYMKGRTDVRTENDVMAILPNFLPSMGYQYFLSYGAPRARAFAFMISWGMVSDKVIVVSAG